MKKMKKGHLEKGAMRLGKNQFRNQKELIYQLENSQSLSANN